MGSDCGLGRLSLASVVVGMLCLVLDLFKPLLYLRVPRRGPRRSWDSNTKCN
jgi:hypothetical protein